MKGKGRWQEAKIGIVLAGIMLAFVLAAMVPMASSESRGDNFNYIQKQTAAQKVLIGQNLQFEGFDTTPVTISRIVSGDIENVYQADDNNRIYNVNWPTSGAFYVNYQAGNQAQLSVENPEMPLELKVGTKKVASLAVGTNLIIDTGGMNLFGNDIVDLVVIGPDGQIKHDKVNDQQFTGIKVSELTANFGDDPGTLETSGWTIGDYTFKVKTKQENACGLEAASSVKPLKIIKGTITIEAETTSTVELETLKLTVTGVADDPITVEASPLSKNVLFKEGIDDTPTGADFHGNWFTDSIDADGIRKYAVEFNHTGTYTIKVTVTDGDREGDSDTVDITVLKQEVVFYLPYEVVIGDTLHVRGTSTSGMHVSVYVDDVLYPQLANMVIEDGEFSKEVLTTNVGMDVPGSVRLKAWIDCEKVAGEERPTRSPDGEEAILLPRPTCTAELSVPSVALEDDFRVLGMAKGQQEVIILSVPPKGGGGKSLLDKGDKGLSPRKASVSTTDDTFSRKMPVQEDATAGYYDIYVMCAGMDNEWGMTGEADLETALNARQGIPSLTEGVITTKTQAEINDILEDLVTTPGSDDLMVELRLKVETAYVKLDLVAAVTAGEPLVVKGTSNRQEGYVIVVTCKGPVELAPHTVKVENDSFGCVFDTTGAVTGEYNVKADDGDGHVDEVEVYVYAVDIDISVLTREEAIERLMAEVIQSSPNADMLVAYGLQHPLSASDLLQSLLPADITSSTAPIGPPYTHGEAWFFWIDDRPQAGYAHTTRFVLIDRATGVVKVTPEEWWPVINDAPCWDTQEIRKSSADIVYEGEHAYESENQKPQILAQVISHQFAVLQAADKTKYAILVRGANEGSPENSVEAMKAQLINIDKFLEGNIKVVKIDKGQKKADPTGKVLKAFEDIVKKIKKDKTEKPKFFFYYVGHANKNAFVFSKKKEKNCEILNYVQSAPYTIVKQNGSLANDSLVSFLLRIPSEDITVIIDACHSSTAIKDLSGWGFKGQILTGANDDGEVRWNYWGLGRTYFTNDLLEGRNKWGSFWEGLNHAASKSKKWKLYANPYPQREKLKGGYREITISGVIKDKKTGKSIPEATVNLAGISPNGINKISKEDVKVNDKGEYKVRFKLIGNFTIEAKAKGYEPEKRSEGLDASYLGLDFSLTRKPPTPTPLLPTPTEP